MGYCAYFAATASSSSSERGSRSGLVQHFRSADSGNGCVPPSKGSPMISFWNFRSGHVSRRSRMPVPLSARHTDHGIIMRTMR